MYFSLDVACLIHSRLVRLISRTIRSTCSTYRSHFSTTYKVVHCLFSVSVHERIQFIYYLSLFLVFSAFFASVGFPLACLFLLLSHPKLFSSALPLLFIGALIELLLSSLPFIVLQCPPSSLFVSSLTIYCSSVPFLELVWLLPAFYYSSVSSLERLSLLPAFYCSSGPTLEHFSLFPAFYCSSALFIKRVCLLLTSHMLLCMSSSLFSYTLSFIVLQRPHLNLLTCFLLLTCFF